MYNCYYLFSPYKNKTNKNENTNATIKCDIVININNEDNKIKKDTKEEV